jgi:pantetheine-phosphate adenylyltransferase
MMSKCFFPGSFDPFTFGHKNIIEKTSKVSEHIIVGIGQHHKKNSLIDINTRETLLNESLKSIDAPNTKIDVIIFDNLLVQAAKDNQCNVIIRGIRDTSDLNYELRMYNTNRIIDPNIVTLFIPTDNNLNHISSSLVRQIYILGGSIESLVPDNINKYLIKNFNSIT